MESSKLGFALLAFLVFCEENGLIAKVEATRGACRCTCTSVLFSSSSSAAEHNGCRLGYFDELPDKLHARPVYRQRGGDTFIYYNARWRSWDVGYKLGADSGLYMKQESNDMLPPAVGWVFWDGEAWRANDDTLMLHHEPFTNRTCDNIRVSSTGPSRLIQSSMMGLYKWEEGQWLCGRKVYHNGHAYLRVKPDTTTWTIGNLKDSGKSRMTSGRATTCPCQEETGPSERFALDWWAYSKFGEWQVDDNITVTCE